MALNSLKQISYLTHNVINKHIYRSLCTSQHIYLPRKFNVNLSSESQFSDKQISNESEEISEYNTTEQLVHKFINKLPGSEEGDVVYDTSFGHLRFDSDNIDTTDEQSVIDQQYFEKSDHSNEVNTSIKPLSTLPDKEHTSYVDKQYFSHTRNNITSTVSSSEAIREVPSRSSLLDEKLSFIDEAYFNTTSDDFMISDLSSFDQSLLNIDNEDISEILKNKNSTLPKEMDAPSKDKRRTLDSSLLKNKQQMKEKSTPPPIAALPSDNDNDFYESLDYKYKGKNKLSDKAPENMSSYDYAIKLRREQSKVPDEETTGYKKILERMINLETMTRADFVKYFKKNILCNQDGIIAVNKPYGLCVHGGELSRRSRAPVLTDLLPDLAKALRTPELHLVHRLDQTSSGCLILAKNKTVASEIKSLFKERKIIKKYYAITRGVPKHEQGIINIPIDMGTINGVHRMILRPDSPGFKDPKGTTQQALTKYKVMSAINTCAVLEVIPTTGITHQIRVHLGLGLGCPILGDHKYTSVKKMVPQKLPTEMLHLMKLKQSKVRDLPIFLHCQSLTIPEYADGINIHIKAEMPKPFVCAIRMLHLGKLHNRRKVKYGEFIDLGYADQQSY